MIASRGIRIKMAQYEAITLGPYQDGKHLSIGLGHNDETLKPDDRISVRDAFALFALDLKEREETVGKLLTKEVPQHVFDGLVSLTYQSGNRYAPALIHLINYDEIGAFAKMYPFAAYRNRKDGEENLEYEAFWKPGLHVRRKDELRVILDGDYGDVTAPIKLWRGPPVGSPEMYVLQPGDID